MCAHVCMCVHVCQKTAPSRMRVYVCTAVVYIYSYLHLFILIMCAYIERDIDIQKDKHHFPLELDPALLFVSAALERAIEFVPLHLMLPIYTHIYTYIYFNYTYTY